MHLPSTPAQVAVLRRASYSPEFNIVVFAALLNLPWEFLQVPFFSGMPNEEHWSGVKTCARATLGDAVIMLLGYWAVAISFRNRYWVSHPGVRELVVFVGVGLAITVVVERMALAGAWLGGWSYSERMYVIPVVEVGLTPILQWLLLPPLTLWFVRRQMAAAPPRARHPLPTAGRDKQFEIAVAAGVGTRHGASGDPYVPGESGSAFASYVFLLDSTGGVEPLPHSVYVAVARAEAVMPGFAGKTFRLADWYVRHRPGHAPHLVSEWYGWIRFDGVGAFDPSASPAEAGTEKWLRFSEQHSPIYKWTAGGLLTVQSCPRRRASLATNARRGGQLGAHQRSSSYAASLSGAKPARYASSGVQRSRLE